MISQMLAQPTHGVVSELSRTYQVSRQTLYRWTTNGRQALEEALGKKPLPRKHTTSLPLLILTMLIENHASYRGIQSTLKNLHGIEISLGTIASVIKEAGRRAQVWMNQQQAETARALALDEQYSSQRGKAYLNVIDVHSGQVWATVPPVEVDGESWTLLLWFLRDQGIISLSTVSDGGRAIQDAVSRVHGEKKHQRDVWHLFHVAAQVQARLDRAVQAESDRLPAIKRQAERVEAGKRARGRHCEVTLPEQQALIAQMSMVADGVRYLCQEWLSILPGEIGEPDFVEMPCTSSERVSPQLIFTRKDRDPQELHALLEVVVLQAGRVLSYEHRRGEIEAVLDLLDELIPLAIPALQKHIRMLSKQIRLALFQALLFARQLEERQEHVSYLLGSEAVALLAWAWLRRTVLDLTNEELLQGLPSQWRAEASKLLSAWDQAVRASSAVENWHSIVRPHLAVHRTLSAGLLALLAVWHHHRIAPRGLHEGFSPLQRTGSPVSQQHWLAALGYSALAA
jgi:hypothetical protein